MGELEDLKKQLSGLKAKRMNDAEISNLKKQIKAEKFAQTKGGKIFHKIADIGDAGKKFLAQPNPKGMKKKKKVPIPSVEEVMARLPA